MDPVEEIDYCGDGCDNAITPWDENTCGCCGREWGEPPTAENVCRSKHVEGEVWHRLLDALHAYEDHN